MEPNYGMSGCGAVQPLSLGPAPGQALRLDLPGYAAYAERLRFR